jgi:hypothetical protein
MHFLIGEAHARQQAIGGNRQFVIEGKRPRHLSRPGRRVHEADERLNRHGGSDFAGIVATHTVGDDEQPQRRIAEETILIEGAGAAF